METSKDNLDQEMILNVKFIKGSEPILIEDDGGEDKVRDIYYSHILQIILYYYDYHLSGGIITNCFEKKYL